MSRRCYDVMKSPGRQKSTLFGLAWLSEFLTMGPRCRYSRLSMDMSYASSTLHGVSTLADLQLRGLLWRNAKGVLNRLTLTG